MKVELDRLLPADGHLDGRDYEARITLDETGKSISFGYSGLASARGTIQTAQIPQSGWCQADLVRVAQNSMIFPFCKSGWGVSFFWNLGGT